MQPDNQQPGWQYKPDGAKPTDAGTLNIDHSAEDVAPAQPPFEEQPQPEPGTQEQKVSAQQEPKQAEPKQPESQQPAMPEEPSPPSQAPANSTTEVSWSASEFIHHDRGASWYAGLFIIAILASGITYLITKDVATAVIFIILAGIVAGFATRKPSNIEYRVASDGIHIGQKFYAFNLFKSFSIINDGGLKSVMLVPLKRFMPPVSMYYAPDDEPTILAILGDRLPQAQAKPEAVERLARRLKL